MKFRIKQNVQFKKNHRGFDSYEFKLGDLLRGERATLGKSLMDIKRELKIDVNIISAIEDCDITGYEDSVFLSGYVRSYAKFLNLDPQWVLGIFCKEAGFTLPTSLDNDKKINNLNRRINIKKTSSYNSLNIQSNIFMDEPSVYNKLKLRSLLSILIIGLMIFGLSFGGWFVIREIQQVNIVEEDIFPIIVEDDAQKQITSIQVMNEKIIHNSEQFFFKPLDGPIVNANIKKSGFFDSEITISKPSLNTLNAKNIGILNNREKTISILASRPAWVRIYTKDGKVINEKILDTAQTLEVPSNIDNIVLRSGNAGSVFIKIDDETFGPVGEGTSVVQNISLKFEDIIENFREVTDSAILKPLKRINLLSKKTE